MIDGKPDSSAAGDGERFMKMALRLARRARERTWPNPMVGAVVVKNGRVLGQGYHRRAGQPHAEALALERAGKAARGSDLYVTLEPCHRHGRTGPCSELIHRAGIRRVFVGTLDPNPREQGRGIATLLRMGIKVETGLLAEECRNLNEVYNVFIGGKRPFVHMKAAASLDGRIAAGSGDARWISSKLARVHAHRLRSRSQAVMVGAGTVRKDDPRLDVRHLRGRNPAVVLLDPRLSVKPRANIFRVERGAPVLVFCRSTASGGMEKRLTGAGAEVIRVRSRRGEMPLEPVLAELLERGVYRLLVEGGSGVFGRLFSRRLVDRVDVIVAGCILGSSGVPMVDMPGPPRVAAAPRLKGVTFKRLGDDMCISGSVSWPD